MFKTLVLILCLLLNSVHGIASVTAIRVYADEGASPDCVAKTITLLKDYVDSQYTISPILAPEVIQGAWIWNTALYVSPGGADILEENLLKGQGNTNIRSFVENGGGYLGICAGAYYASGVVQFYENKALTINQMRDLGFFPGVAMGPILAPYNPNSNSGALAPTLTFNTNLNLSPAHLFYNGGPCFAQAEDYPGIEVLGRFQEMKIPAAALLYTTPGKGHAVLSAVHPEFNEGNLDPNDPYLAPLIPLLTQSKSTRRALVKNIFQKLNIKVQS